MSFNVFNSSFKTKSTTSIKSTEQKKENKQTANDY